MARRHFCIHRSILIGLAPLTVLLSGCGMAPYNPPAAKTAFATQCERMTDDSISYANLVILDWTGGVNPIYPDRTLQGIDLSLFPTAGGGTLADDAEAFKEAVVEEMDRIFCEYPDTHVLVAGGEDDVEGLSADTVVHVTQEVKPDGGFDIGQGEYDPCDQQDDNAAIIFGKRILQLGGTYTFDEWVNVFANVTAHEVGHTLGYGHISREQRPDTGRSLVVELMLDRHTMSEMRKAQRFLVDQSNCPNEPLAEGAALQGAAILCTHDLTEHD